MLSGLRSILISAETPPLKYAIRNHDVADIISKTSETKVTFKYFTQ